MFYPKYGDIIVTNNGNRYVCVTAEEVLAKVGSNPDEKYSHMPIHAYPETCRMWCFMAWNYDGKADSWSYGIKEVISMNKPKPHKHAAVIKAWAEGAVIQQRISWNYEWGDCPANQPSFHNDIEYRVRPEVKPDVVKYINAGQKSVSALSNRQGHFSNLKLTFCGETDKLKSAEVLSVEGGN